MATIYNEGTGLVRLSKDEFESKGNQILSCLDGLSIIESSELLDYVKSILPLHSYVKLPENNSL